MPEIDLARTSETWLAFYVPGDERQHFSHVDTVRRTLRNTQIGPDDTTAFYGIEVDESDCKAMLSAMGRQS